MNEENKPRQVIIMSLAALLIGILLFIFGLSVSTSLVPLFMNYFIAMALYLSAFLAVYHQHQSKSYHIYKYLMTLSIFFMVLCTVVIYII